MKEVEITLKVNDSLEDCVKKLEKQSFKVIRNGVVDDLYMTQNKNKLNKDNIDDILKTCVLIRYLNANGEEFKKITYKNKVYNNGNIISERKINVDCLDLAKARELFEALEFEELVRVKYKVTVLADGNKELAFQEVENLGLLVEYESRKEMENILDEEILQVKNDMIEEILQTGILVDKGTDVKKAYEIIKNSVL